MGQYITDQIDGNVATITINNPPRNIITLPLMDELEATIDALSENLAIKAVVLTGDGSVFIAGADVREILAIPNAREGEKLSKRGHAMFNKIEWMRKPVVAAINGFCLGGGLELALACHIRIAGDRARLGLPEIGLGIMPGFGGTQRLPRLVGMAKAMELILTGDMVSAEEAKAIGLVNRVVPETEVLKEAQGLAKKIAAKGRMAIAAAMKAISEESGQNLSAGLSLEAEIFGTLCETADMKEGLSAFVEKRQPKFLDR
ncbi:MAG: enoyl-CoA hydratase/isomerase family protein [Nitrospirae bacterium]|nr:enoyl-CoA hydratase/isomerase family protein [Candidatus Troglogloeales bacterium]